MRPMGVRFGVRHQPEQTAGLITESGDGTAGTVWIERIVHRDFPFRIGIRERREMFVGDSIEGCVIGKELPFAMTNREVGGLDPRV